jgi:phosphomannomutase
MQASHHLSEEILKTCDIRGIVGDDLNEKDAFFIGKAFGTALLRMGKKRCLVGFDGRFSSPSLSRRLVEGLISCGISVTKIGLVPTPELYFAMHHWNMDAGVVVTASHNPAEYNGFKFLTSEGPFHEKAIQEFRRLCENGDFEEGEGNERFRSIDDDYIMYLLGHLELPEARTLSVVWDPGNGSAGKILPSIVKGLPGSHRIICGEVDGSFPHHHPDPSLKENMNMLAGAVQEEHADLGIAFDGDGDRIGVVDGEGYIFMGDQLLTIFARDYLASHPGATVMSEVKASRFFFDDVASHGGVPLMWKVGHTNQKEKMKREGIGLAGETSGHIFFEENKGYDDGLFAAIKLINILSHSSRSITEMRKAFPRFYDSGEIRITLSRKERERVVKEISQRLKAKGLPFTDIDGIRAHCGDGFWMLRGSNTQPHITIRCEAASPAGLDACMAVMRKELALSGIAESMLEAKG